MGVDEKVGVGKEKNEDELPAGLTFAVAMLGLRVLQLLYGFITKIGVYDGLQYRVIIFSVLLLALIHSVSIWGLLRKKRFVLYSVPFFVVIDVLVNLITAYLLTMMILVTVGVFVIFAVSANAKNLNPFNDTDKKILAGLLMVVLLYMAGYYYIAHLPSPEEHAATVTQEAIQKGDWRVCEKISQSFWKDNCISSFANSVGDISLCNEIKSVNVRDNCKQEVS